MGPHTAATGDAAGAASSEWSSDPDSPTATLSRDVPGASPVIPGHVSIAPRALQRVGSAIVADELRVSHHDVRVDAHDDEGRLALRVATPLSIPRLDAATEAPVGGVIGTVRSLQETVTRRVNEIAGRAVSRVDVTITGSQLEKKEELR
ncbi:hypothetical protein [Frondihabitans sp. VKM Ac-2883]|uniref:hypothetical protein n=1 Tax=Frondihabitans sp. VKM Ac-2883 TaxID=2783823 RepID=UPI00188BEDA0|nr:hypothetical protein [Frondihabitans sp. VKM Ac-2883]MBF4577127.1 hypothetical protein [Frondihabitans sp. VKM Ac-2883]